MEVSRRTVLLGAAGAVLIATLPQATRAEAAVSVLQLDFGPTATPPAAGYVRTGVEAYSATRGYGWVSATGLATRDRGGDALRRDFVFGATSRVFRIGNLTPGRYRLSLLTGDYTFADHTLQVQALGVDGGPLPVLRPSFAQFGTLTATLVVATGTSAIDLTISAPSNNWVLNALTLESDVTAEAPQVTWANAPIPSQWGPILSSPDPTLALLAGHRERAAGRTAAASGLNRNDYLRIITGEVDFWKNSQNANGAIIDPQRNREFQYSTPAFAHAAAVLVAFDGRSDLVNTAALALDWSTQALAAQTAADGHEDFYPPMIAHAMRLLTPHVSAERSAGWRSKISSFEPFGHYYVTPGGSNWNIVSASGEAQFQEDGLRVANNRYVEASFAAQGHVFDPSNGLYLEGPLAYDHFPRMFIADLIAQGYSGPYAAELTESARRASIVSLFMQSPTGELPAGGRSAHHQWNEAEQCVTYEVFAARALAEGDAELAAYFKRAARLALASMFRWVRTSGEMQIIKNWSDPAGRIGYESYSAHSQYNLLPMSMLALAFEYSADTEQVEERPTPAEVGGYVLHVEGLHIVIASAGGAYVQIETAGDHKYDATGLIRAHFAGHSPQLGSSDSLVTAPAYKVIAGPASPTTGIGVAWETSPGVWRHFGELAPSLTSSATVAAGQSTAERVVFTVSYAGDFGGGVTAVEEQFELTPARVTVTTRLPGYTGRVRRVAPLLSHDGRTPAVIAVEGEEASVRQPTIGGAPTSTLVYRMRAAQTVGVGPTEYGNHNGLMRLAIGEYVAGAGAAGVTVDISAQSDVTVTVTARTVAGRVHLIAQARNGSGVPVDAEVKSAYGTKTFSGLAPGKAVSQVFNTRATSIPAGLVYLTARTTEGAVVTTIAEYEAYSA